MGAQFIHIGGADYVVIERAEYERLKTLAKAEALPALPAADAAGNYPAVEYARASLARKIIRNRAAAGLTQRQLAKAAGIREETLCRLEQGKHTPTLRTIDRIDRAIQQAVQSGDGAAKARRRRKAR